MVSDRCEVWEIASQNAVDRRKEPPRVIGIVEDALMQDHMGSFGLDEPENASEIRAVPAVADEGYFQVRVRGDRARRSLCVPPCGLKGDCEENRQNASGNEARNSVGVPLAAANRDHLRPRLTNLFASQSTAM